MNSMKIKNFDFKKGFTLLEVMVVMAMITIMVAVTLVYLGGLRAQREVDMAAREVAAAGLVVGWPAIVTTVTLSFFIGAVVGIILILSGRKTMKSQIPFAPFLASAVFIVVFIAKIFPAIKYWLPYF